MAKQHFNFPLATFIVVAYNQESYIREAIEGAFSQTYTPLEIILSDDCSTDKTFKIMQEMAFMYQGSHLLKVRSTKHNQGTFNHVLECISEAQGDLIILAAGDDISHPQRTALIVDEWIQTQSMALYSDFVVINTNSEKILNKINNKPFHNELRHWFAQEKNIAFIHGAISAYDKQMFSYLPKSDSVIYSEDVIFSFVINLKKLKFSHIKKDLVSYRQHENAISNNASKTHRISDIKELEVKLSKIATSELAIVNYINKLYSTKDVKYNFLRDKLLSTQRYYTMVKLWIYMSTLDRLKYLLKCRQLREIKFLFPRLFGLNFFAFLKLLILRLK